jgi:hypothetical protein
LTGLLNHSWLLPLDPQQSCWRCLTTRLTGYRCFGASIASICSTRHFRLLCIVVRKRLRSRQNATSTDGDVIRYGRFSRYMLPFSNPCLNNTLPWYASRETWCCTFGGISVRATINEKQRFPKCVPENERALILAHNQCQGLDRNGNAFFVML